MSHDIFVSRSYGVSYGVLEAKEQQYREMLKIGFN